MNDTFRVVAIISTFNEEDIISQVIGHLVRNGIEVYLIDNHSTDETVREASQWLGRGLINIEKFPENLRQNHESYNFYDWTGILHRKEELAREISADWFIHHDADEIREGPWPGLTLKEAIHWVDTLGYNCIDFRIFNFPPVDDGFKRGEDPRSYFTFYEECPEYDRIQIKCWKSGLAPISLIPSGGHRILFEGMCVFPIKFILCHYPIRGQKHGRKKVFEERKKRFLNIERSKGWHVQYEHFKDESYCFLRNPSDLHPFNLNKARLELMLSDKIISYLEFREKKANDELYYLQSCVKELERNAEQLQHRIGVLERNSEELEHHLKNIQNSLSWRITAPLRAIYDWLQRLKGNSI